MVLFEDKTQCCGCGACINACPQKAISIREDESGFIYPVINAEKCVNCGICKQVCGYRKPEKDGLTDTSAVYAAKGRDKKLIKKSSSGGVFATLAKIVILEGGIVFGCTLEQINGKLVPHHIAIDCVEDLYKIQGSKYVQSFIEETYKQAKEALDNGKAVLFSGTPCQIAGLKSFLKREYNNLLTVDLVCHGVPSASLFNSYIKFEEEELGSTISEISFRNKTDFRITLGYSVMGKEKIKKIPSALSSFYSYFLSGDIYRENCYSCKYASSKRVSDITLGDYWGLSVVHSKAELNKGRLKEKDGVSCLLLNSEKGKNFFFKHMDAFDYINSDFFKASLFNGQLIKPCVKSRVRCDLLKLFREKDYSAVDKYYYKELGIKKYVYIIWCYVPIGLQKYYCEKRGIYLKREEYRKYMQKGVI